MSRSISQRAFMVFGGLALAGTLTLAQAAPVAFQVPLTGAQQVPPVQPYSMRALPPRSLMKSAPSPAAR